MEWGMSVTSVILGNEPSTQIGWHSLCILEQNVHGKCDTSANKIKMYWHSLDSYFFNDPSIYTCATFPTGTQSQWEQ